MPERVLASALLVSMALAIMRLAVLATGSAAVGGAAGLAWLLMLSDPRMLVPPYLPESLGAAVFMLGLLAFHERRFRLHAACVVLACAVHPMVLLFVPFWAVFAAFSLREGGWGLMWLAAASIALLSWTMLTLVFTSGASLPQEIQHVAMFLGDDARRVTEGWVLGALALLLPVGALALMRPGAALLLLPPALVWGAPVLMFPTATFQPGYPAVAPLCLAMIFYAAVQSAHRFAFGRVLLPGSEDEAQAVVAASPASPPPPLPPLREAELWRDRPVAAIPRPWTVQQLIRLRCLVAFLVVAPLSLQLIRLLLP
jgi:hypothetical protein